MAIFSILFTLALGFGFYQLRSRRPLYFGLVEVLLAIGLAFLTFVPAQDVLFLEESPSWGEPLSDAIGGLAAVYVMVDGLGSIGGALPKHSKWKWMF